AGGTGRLSVRAGRVPGRYRSNRSDRVRLQSCGAADTDSLDDSFRGAGCRGHHGRKFRRNHRLVLRISRADHGPERSGHRCIDVADQRSAAVRKFGAVRRFAIYASAGHTGRQLLDHSHQPQRHGRARSRREASRIVRHHAGRHGLSTQCRSPRPGSRFRLADLAGNGRNRDGFGRQHPRARRQGKRGHARYGLAGRHHGNGALDRSGNDDPRDSNCVDGTRRGGGDRRRHNDDYRRERDGVDPACDVHDDERSGRQSDTVHQLRGSSGDAQQRLWRRFLGRRHPGNGQRLSRGARQQRAGSGRRHRLLRVSRERRRDSIRPGNGPNARSVADSRAVADDRRDRFSQSEAVHAEQRDRAADRRRRLLRALVPKTDHWQWYVEQFSPTELHHHAIEETYHAGRTAFQDVAVIRTATFGKMLVLDGDTQSSQADEKIYHESLVHPALAACAARREVLILGGGEGATLREVLRHPDVARCTMVDI
ncbi:MAG: hypothetical protein IAI50_21870, partial [Candidatus Eremiobacteraeota bacterium]|nr:hypothetical protein [Candidatus Eremiobacteraeota bacterium]